MIKNDSQRGFTVIETLVATVLLVALGIGTLGLLQTFTHAIGFRTSASGGSSAAEGTLMSMRSDAATAFAVFVPTNDVFGNPNAQAGQNGHEVDYYSKAEDGSEAWWAYTYDAAKKTVRRWDYEPNGGNNTVGALDRTSGSVNTAASYPEITGVTAFTAHTIEANQLTTASNTFSPLISQLTGTAGTAPIADPVGFSPQSGQTRTDLYGGNTTVEVSVTTAQDTHTFHLATTALPSGFTIHAKPAIRAFAYRLDYGHRFWFGFAQKTWARVFEQLQYSYTPNTVGSWKVWCDYEVYGANSNGLALNDPNAVYNPKNNWFDTTAETFYKVTQGSLAGLNPNCTGKGQQLPSRNATAATPGPLVGTPDVVDTPPPCFSAGTCWPQGAPVNWAPASPWPAQSPPPAWCVTHNLSTLCGGPGGPPQQVSSSASPDPMLTTYPTAGPTTNPYPTSFPSPVIRPTKDPGPIKGPIAL